MIASTPVARWTWGRDDETADPLLLCLSDLLIAYSVLVRHRLAVGEPNVRLKVPEAGKPNNRLFQGELTPDEAHSPQHAAAQLAHQVREALTPGEIGSVEADLSCTGVLVGANAEEAEQGLFQLGAAAYRDYVTVDLVTFIDAWMPYDLKGQPHPAVHAANAPRLKAALHDLADTLRSETDPDDPTYFGKPTPTGIDNRYEPDGSPSNVWARFEVP